MKLSRKTLAGMVLTLILTSILASAFNIQSAKTDSTTYMRIYLPNEWISDGTAMGWHADDMSWSYTLPFDFPFFGTTYTTIYISSNGLIAFTGPDSTYSNSIPNLAGKLAIAPAWDDWETYAPHDVYIWQPDSTSVAIRWEVAALYSGLAANFEAILGSNGVIKFNYGQNDGPISATVGISNGAGEILAEDVADLNYINTILFTPFRPEHDLDVRLEAPTFVAPDRSTFLNATAKNSGLNNETSVELQLLVNGTIVDSVVIPELLNGSSHTLSYSWTPTDEGLYNVTAYAPLVPGENVTANNVATKFVEVMYPLINPIEGQWANYTAYYFEGDRITGTEQWGFTYDHYVSPSQINITVWYKDPMGYTHTGWMVVNIFTRYVESGVYWTGMWYYGWIETNITTSSTINLGDSTATVVGSRILELDGNFTDCWELKHHVYTYWYDKKTGLWIGMDYPYYSGLNLTLVATNIPIGKLPVASFTYTPRDPFAGETVTFDASASYDPDGAIVSYVWDFGDDTTGSGMTTNHAYTAEGAYTVTLTVKDNDELNTTVTTTVDVSRVALDVKVTMGSIYFTGEMAEFYVSVSRLGKRVNANINATLYYANGTLHSNLSASMEHIATGLYRIPYTLPLNATAGTYVLVADASFLTLEGTSMESFLLSPTLNGWNPLLVSIDGTAATIKTDLGLIMVKLDAINATVTHIDGTTATIQTTLGLMNGTIIDCMENGIATIQTPVGQIQADISNLKGTQETLTIPVQYLITALALMAAAGSMLSIILLRRKKTTQTN